MRALGVRGSQRKKVANMDPTRKEGVIYSP